MVQSQPDKWQEGHDQEVDSTQEMYVNPAIDASEDVVFVGNFEYNDVQAPLELSQLWACFGDAIKSGRHD